MPVIPILVIAGAALATGLGLKYAGDGIGEAAKETSNSTIKMAIVAGIGYLALKKLK